MDRRRNRGWENLVSRHDRPHLLRRAVEAGTRDYLGAQDLDQQIAAILGPPAHA